mgnify:CR=1 FL=1
MANYLVQEHLLLLRGDAGGRDLRHSCEEDKPFGAIVGSCLKMFETLSERSKMFASNFLTSVGELYFGKDTFNGWYISIPFAFSHIGSTL